MTALMKMIPTLINLTRLRWKVAKQTAIDHFAIKQIVKKITSKPEQIGMTVETFELRILQEILHLVMIRKYISGATSYVDVGANIGMNSLAALYYFDSSIPIAMIEPSIDCQPILRSIQANSSNMFFLNYAVGAEAGVADFNRSLSSPTSQASSMLEFSEKYKTEQSHAKAPIETEKVKVVRLDSIEQLENVALGHSIIMHIDVEGFEYQALLGAKAILERTQIIILEASRSLFVGQKSFDELYSLLRDTHELLCASGEPMLSPNGEVLVQDYIFLRKLT